jgi:5'-nucleotidase
LRKAELLKAFGAHIFFDDQDTHLSASSKYVPAGKVPYYSGSEINSVIEEKKKKENND